MSLTSLALAMGLQPVDLVLPLALFGWFSLGAIFYYAGHALYDLTHPEMKHQKQSNLPTE